MPDGQYLATLDQQSVFIWHNQQRVRTVTIKIAEPTALALNNNGILLIGDKDGTVYFFSEKEGVEKKLRANYDNQPILNIIFINNQGRLNGPYS